MTQPFLHDQILTVHAPAMAWSRADGQLRGQGADGCYLGDRRLLSVLVVTVDGIEPAAVVGQTLPSGAARFVGVARGLGDPGKDPTVLVERSRSAIGDGVCESVTISSRAREQVTCTLSVTAGSDLSNLAAVRAGQPITALAPERVDVSGISWRGPDGARAVLDVVPAADIVADTGRLDWSVRLAPRGRFTIELQVTATDDPLPPAVLPVTGAPFAPPSVPSGDRRLTALVDQSVTDLNNLACADPDDPRDLFLAAGAPWYLTLFGRDSLWAARLSLPLGTAIAGGTLRALHRRQGTNTDDRAAEQPGKILHEQRRSALELTDRDGSELFLPARYYGTVDATPLWISLLHDAWRWGLPDDEVRGLLPGLVAALGWLRDFALDDSGFLRYVDRTGRGLANQGWKDSYDAVQFSTGALAVAPIALCEAQGYAHLAAVHGADLLDAFGLPDGDGWRQWAAKLADRFRDRFWVDDPDGDYPAVALDRDGRPVDTVTSNIGHLLGTGLLDADETELVVGRLASSALDSGFGLRTMSSGARGFNPLSYHCGSVWSHDTAIAISGLASVGTPGAHAAAGSLIDGLLRAGTSFDYRLPELHGGETARPGDDPVPYPTSCRPQAWSAAAAPAILAALIGLAPDVPTRTLRLSPLVPSPVGELTVRGLRIAGERLDLHLSSDGVVEVLAAPSWLRVETGPEHDGQR